MTTKRIAVVEDDAAILQLLKNLLVEENFEVLCFPDVLSFKAGLQNSILPDLVLLDIWLDDEKSGGENLAVVLKSGNETKHIPIIIMSASSEIEKITNEVQADDFISKPFEIDDVLKKVREYV